MSQSLDRQRLLLTGCIHAVASISVFWLVLKVIQSDLGPDPIKTLLLTTGEWGPLVPDSFTNGQSIAVVIRCVSANGNSPASWFVGLCLFLVTRSHFSTGVCGLVAITAYRRAGRAPLYNCRLFGLAAIATFGDHFYGKLASPIR